MSTEHSGNPGLTPPAGPHGMLVVDKPLGPSSMQMCRIVKRRLINGGAPKGVKVGHGGTLDPLATGVLVVMVGRATKLCDKVMAGAKQYETQIDLSAFSTTDDAEGERTIVSVDVPPDLQTVQAACAKFVGTIMQKPPIYSAIKIDGQPAYKAARQGLGDSLKLTARPVRVDGIAVVRYEWPTLVLLVDCGKGVYIRSLARDIGTTLGTGGMLTALRRTRVGMFDIADASTPDAMANVLTEADLLPLAAFVPDAIG